MAHEASQQYDVFVSYSHADSHWVQSELLPRLENWGIAICVDSRHFAEGRPVTAELRRLVAASRRTLFVLSSRWLASSFAAFELQLSSEFAPQGDVDRFIPLKIEAAETPLLLHQFQVIDAPHLGWAAAWKVLHRALVAGRPPEDTGVLASELLLSRDFGEEGYSYVADLLVANIGEQPCAFDAVQIEIRGVEADTAIDRPNAFRISWGGGKQRMAISYHGRNYFAGLRRIRATAADREEGEAETISLSPLQGEWSRHVRFDRAAATMAAKQFVMMSIQLLLAESPVTQACVCVLPPLLRLPLQRAGESHRVVLAREPWVPAPSGIVDREIMDRVIETAHRRDSDCLLVSARPGFERVHKLTGGDVVHECRDWQFSFYADRLGGTFDIASADPTWTNEEAVTKERRPVAWLNGILVHRCRLDCRIAYLIARSAGLRPTSGRTFLETRVLSGEWRPVWGVPFTEGDCAVGVLADTGELISIASKDGAVQKLDGTIWNC